MAARLPPTPEEQRIWRERFAARLDALADLIEANPRQTYGTVVVSPQGRHVTITLRVSHPALPEVYYDQHAKQRADHDAAQPAGGGEPGTAAAPVVQGAPGDGSRESDH
jgi:hypothetical protein